MSIRINAAEPTMSQPLKQASTPSSRLPTTPPASLPPPPPPAPPLPVHQPLLHTPPTKRSAAAADLTTPAGRLPPNNAFYTALESPDVAALRRSRRTKRAKRAFDPSASPLLPPSNMPLHHTPTNASKSAGCRSPVISSRVAILTRNLATTLRKRSS